MSTPLKVVAICPGTSRASRPLALTETIISEIGQHLIIGTHWIERGNIARPLCGAPWRNELPETVENERRQIEAADLLVVTAPIYRDTYPGLFKHLFDLIGQDALVDTPVPLAATGGSERQALTLPIGVYASEPDFADCRIVSQPLQARIELAAERAAGLILGQARALRKIA